MQWSWEERIRQLIKTDLAAAYEALKAMDQITNYKLSAEQQNLWDTYSAALHGYKSAKAWKSRRLNWVR